MSNDWVGFYKVQIDYYNTLDELDKVRYGGFSGFSGFEWDYQHTDMTYDQYVEIYNYWVIKYNQLINTASSIIKLYSSDSWTIPAPNWPAVRGDYLEVSRTGGLLYTPAFSVVRFTNIPGNLISAKLQLNLVSGYNIYFSTKIERWYRYYDESYEEMTDFVALVAEDGLNALGLREFDVLAAIQAAGGVSIDFRLYPQEMVWGWNNWAKRYARDAVLELVIAPINKTLKVTLTITPSNVPFYISTWIGPDQNTKIVAPPTVSLTSTGVFQVVDFPYVLPSSGGPYKVFVQVEISGTKYLWIGDSSSYVMDGVVG